MPSRITHTPLLPSTLLWCCGNVKYCDDVAELLLSLTLPHQSMEMRGETAREGTTTQTLQASFSLFPADMYVVFPYQMKNWISEIVGGNKVKKNKKIR